MLLVGRLWTTQKPTFAPVKTQKGNRPACASLAASKASGKRKAFQAEKKNRKTKNKQKKKLTQKSIWWTKSLKSYFLKLTKTPYPASRLENPPSAPPTFGPTRRKAAAAERREGERRMRKRLGFSWKMFVWFWWKWWSIGSEVWSKFFSFLVFCYLMKFDDVFFKGFFLILAVFDTQNRFAHPFLDGLRLDGLTGRVQLGILLRVAWSLCGWVLIPY